MRELRVAQQAGEDWAEEGGTHIFKVDNSFLDRNGARLYIYLLNELFNLIQVVKEVGKRMMEKAYMGEPARQSRSLSNEE